MSQLQVATTISKNILFHRNYLLICHFLFIWVLHANCLIYPPNYNKVDIVGLQVKADLNNLIVAILKLKLVSAINPPRAGSKIPYLVL
jgi:hypothetical protein